MNCLKRNSLWEKCRRSVEIAAIQFPGSRIQAAGEVSKSREGFETTEVSNSGSLEVSQIEQIEQLKQLEWPWEFWISSRSPNDSSI